MGFINILDPIFQPLLGLHPAVSIFIISLLITFIITIVYKYATDQKKMKQLKTDLKTHQEKIKEYSKKNDPKKAMELQGQAMKSNLEYMKHSFKATLWTMLPVLVIFLWMSQNLAYHPIAPGQEFSVIAEFKQGHAPAASLSTIPDLEIVGGAVQEINYSEKYGMDTAEWRLKAPTAGDYKLEIDYNSEKYEHTVLISNDKRYSTPEKPISDSKLSKIIVGYDKIYPFTLFGLRFTWFWAYLVMSVALSMIIRKILKVY